MTERVKSRVREDGCVHCSRCKEYRPPDEFSPHARRPGEKLAWCKPCMAEHYREKRAKERGDRPPAGVPNDISRAIYAAYQQGESVTGLSRRLRLSRMTIYKHIDRHGGRDRIAS